MNHKRGRAKKQRAGCLFCKPHKANGAGRQALTVQDLRAPDLGHELADYEVKGSELDRTSADAMLEEQAEITDDFWCFGGSWEGWARW
jgi:hypothetical protein